MPTPQKMQKLLMIGILEVPDMRKEEMLVMEVTVIETPAAFMQRPSRAWAGLPLSNTDRLSMACHIECITFTISQVSNKKFKSSIQILYCNHLSIMGFFR